MLRALSRKRTICKLSALLRERFGGRAAECMRAPTLLAVASPTLASSMKCTRVSHQCIRRRAARDVTETRLKSTSKIASLTTR